MTEYNSKNIIRLLFIILHYYFQIAKYFHFLNSQKQTIPFKLLLNIFIIFGIVVANLTVIIIFCGDLTHYD